VSVVVPVKDNQEGVDRLVRSLNTLTTKPLEIIIVDNLSAEMIQLPESEIDIHGVRCGRIGPAAARNSGAKLARGEWIWFLDSDCEVLPGTLDSYISSSGGALGYSGNVKSAGRGLLSRYYEAQEILIPQFGDLNDPLYLITANAIIERNLFFDLGCFDEAFPAAAGEDIDLGFRIHNHSLLVFSEGAIVLHHFEECIDAFKKRFRRYGGGNYILAQKYKLNLFPSPFEPNRKNYFHSTLAKIQYEALREGYEEKQK
jgi:glycosyltransferase involved in cell wall biosynthesis